LLSIKNAEYQDEYKIKVKFSDNKEGLVDLKDFIENGRIEPFKRLQDKKEFQNFRVDYTIRWNDELDLAPEYIYFKAFEDDITLKEKFLDWGYM